MSVCRSGRRRSFGAGGGNGSYRGAATAAELLRPSGSFGRSGTLAQEALDRWGIHALLTLR